MSETPSSMETDQQATHEQENPATQPVEAAAASSTSSPSSSPTPPPSSSTLTPPPPPPPPPSHPQPFVRPPPSQSFDPAAVFFEAYDCAKLNNNWNKVSSSLMIHPEWLSRIPEGRRWTMLHQIVFSGNVMHLNEVLALQASNPQFRLLCKTLDNKTVREVAAERAHIHPQMMRRIERLVAVDQLLNNAKDRKWELVKQCISLQPDIVNEKPPYRRFYLAHHLAFVGELDIFKDLSTICHFKLDLVADNKTISQVAREHNRIEFAEYIDNLTKESDETTASNTHEASATHSSGAHSTGTHNYSPAFYDDPCISFIPANINVANLFLPTNDTLSYPGGHHSMNTNHVENIDNGYATHSLYHGPHTTLPTTMIHGSTFEEDEEVTATKPVQPKPSVPEMTDDEQKDYEKTVISNVQKMSQQNLLNSITCCITKEILRDPVVAADGFTYERAAILSWFETSNRSPMTNQELDNLELKPNFAIKSILQLLQGGNTSDETAKKS
ncbi:unnamed protein product [Adineta steineri]|uniref:U-box domain-containing protein n=1 Tax=Adineta steineri TaxID=433720 RepID=A0A819E642_9BILA|nr:unnamed protein product [Adineta steineri]CAF3844944.1 unnamed protein product [Adineta steineri]